MWEFDVTNVHITIFVQVKSLFTFFIDINLYKSCLLILSLFYHRHISSQIIFFCYLAYFEQLRNRTNIKWIITNNSFKFKRKNEHEKIVFWYSSMCQPKIECNANIFYYNLLTQAKNEVIIIVYVWYLSWFTFVSNVH